MSLASVDAADEGLKLVVRRGEGPEQSDETAVACDAVLQHYRVVVTSAENPPDRVTVVQHGSGEPLERSVTCGV